MEVTKWRCSTDCSTSDTVWIRWRETFWSPFYLQEYRRRRLQSPESNLWSETSKQASVYWPSEQIREMCIGKVVCSLCRTVFHGSIRPLGLLWTWQFVNSIQASQLLICIADRRRPPQSIVRYNGPPSHPEKDKPPRTKCRWGRGSLNMSCQMSPLPMGSSRSYCDVELERLYIVGAEYLYL